MLRSSDRRLCPKRELTTLPWRKILPLDTRQEREYFLLSNAEGYNAAINRIAAGDAGPAHPEDACSRADAWVGRSPAHSAVVERRIADWPRSLYPALYRLEYKGWIRSDWGNSENNRRAKFYRLTTAGRKQLEAELATWDRLTSAIASVLGSEAEASL